MRDGKELVKLPVKLPEKPPANSYGRPLFQAMSYHDTPEPPVAEMRYLDTSAKAGEKVRNVPMFSSLEVPLSFLLASWLHVLIASSLWVIRHVRPPGACTVTASTRPRPAPWVGPRLPAIRTPLPCL